MKSSEIKTKLEAAKVKVEKIQNTIERHEKRAAKFLNIIHNNGWDENNPWCMKDTPKHQDCYWTIRDLEHAMEDARNANKKLHDAKRIMEDWEHRLKIQTKKERMLENEIPESLKALQAKLTKTYIEQSKSIQNEIEDLKSQMATDEISRTFFNRMFSRTQMETYYKTDKEIAEEAAETAEIFVLDLYNRVKEITGNITDWANIQFYRNALNGYVIGEEGTAEVETIIAGGYNIQKLHYRVLVKRI